jgi:hypothetical protein
VTRYQAGGIRRKYLLTRRRFRAARDLPVVADRMRDHRSQRLCPHEHISREWGTDELWCDDCHLYLGQGNNVPGWATTREQQKRVHDGR